MRTIRSKKYGPFTAKTVFLYAGAIFVPYLLMSGALLVHHLDDSIAAKSSFIQHWSKLASVIASESSDTIDENLFIDNDFASYLYHLPAISDDIISILLLDNYDRPIFTVGDTRNEDSLLTYFVSGSHSGMDIVALPDETMLDYSIFSSPVTRDNKILAVLVITVDQGMIYEGFSSSLAGAFSAALIPIILWGILVIYVAYRIRRYTFANERFRAIEMELASMDSGLTDFENLVENSLKELICTLGLRDGSLYMKNSATGAIELLARYSLADSARKSGEEAFIPGDPRLQVMADGQLRIYSRTSAGRTLLIESIDKKVENARIAISLKGDSESFGLLDLGISAGMKFDRRKIEICRRLAERIAASMHQKMKLAEALRQAYESKLMLEAVDIVDSSENLIAALTELSGKIIELEYISFCRIFLVDEGGKKLILTAETGSGEGVSTGAADKAYDIEDLPIHKIAILSGQSQILKTEEIERLFLEKKDFYRPGMENGVAMITPLIYDDRQLGCFSVGIDSRPDFPLEMKDLLEDLAHHVSSSIHRSQFCSRLKRSFDRLQAAQNRSVQLERLRAIMSMSEGISRSLEEFLGSIKNEIDGLRSKPVNERIAAILKSINATIDDYDMMIEKFKSFSSLGEDRKFQQVELARIIQEIEKQLREDGQIGHEASGDIRMDVRITGSGQIFGDPEELGAMIKDMVRNSVEAMPHGGTITIESLVEHKQAILEISDQGAGMSAEIKSRIFEPFFTTKEGVGRGLGMSKVYGIITAHNGTIDIESEIGRGSKITVKIPLVDPEQTALYEVKKGTAKGVPLSHS
jgi:signal transduction histidine kinase